MGPAAGRVVRGGSWNNNRDNAACSYRNNEHPNNRNNNLGFRCAKTPPAFAHTAAEAAGRPSFYGGRPRAVVMSRPPVRRRPGCGPDKDDYARRRAGIPVGRRADF